MPSIVNDENLYVAMSSVLQKARQTVYRAVNFTMVNAYWEIGRLITEDELKWERAEYGKHILKNLSQRLTSEFGKGFDESNLRYMKLFFKAFPICNTLRHELSWSHYRNDTKQIFASKYKLTLPSEEVLKLELETERHKLEK